MGQDTVWAGILWRNTMKNQPGTMKQKCYTRGVTNDLGGGGAGMNKINKNVTHSGSQLIWEGGWAGINKINKNVTHAGSQLTF